jgi:hypothetical protein
MAIALDQKPRDQEGQARARVHVPRPDGPAIFVSLRAVEDLKWSHWLYLATTQRPLLSNTAKQLLWFQQVVPMQCMPQGVNATTPFLDVEHSFCCRDRGSGKSL